MEEQWPRASTLNSRRTAGGFCLCVVPSLDLVIDKLGGKDGQYDPTLIPQPEQKHDRDNWQPIPNNAFHEGTQGTSLGRILDMVCAAVQVE